MSDARDDKWESLFRDSMEEVGLAYLPPEWRMGLWKQALEKFAAKVSAVSHAPRKECCGLGFKAGVSECPGCPRASAASTTARTTVATVVTAALVMAKGTLERWAELYGKLSEAYPKVRQMDYNLPPGDHVRTLEAIDVAIPESKVSAASATPCSVTDAMVDRFLSWKLPEDFHPDAGISFSPYFNVEYNAKHGKPPQRHEPIGTNLLTATQARAMLEHVLRRPDGGKQT